MRFRIVQTLPGPPADVFATLQSRSFRELMDARLGMDKTLLDAEERDGGLLERWKVVERSELPPFVAKTIGSVLEYTLEHAIFTVERRVSWRVVPAMGADRVRAEGVERIEPEGEGSRRTVEGLVEVSAPLVGRKLSDYIGGEVEKGFRKALPFIESYIAERFRG